ncbi:hypothetical protein WA026_020193 [Henosepilachna vigintioctopunctata]|uniref:Sushi domain-containing protein n=1 Tax=Henosepilachna vigintioctopunctata TaxID=420089 RepID=A0AAW1UA72_9CUCU
MPGCLLCEDSRPNYLVQSSKLFIFFVFLILVNFSCGTKVSKECRFPGAPAHSSVTFTKENLGPGAVATYSCERGFELLGPSRRVCQNGEWLPEGIPFCALFRTA